MERVNFTVKIYDNFLEIIPEDGVKENSIYEIRLKNLKDVNKSKELESKTLNIYTKMTPAYAPLESVKSLIDGCGVEDHIILYHIREASKHADYVHRCVADYGGGGPILSDESIVFQKEQFVKYKAAYECILKFYMDMAADAGIKGTLGDISFDVDAKLPDISKLLGSLKLEVEEWELSLQGHTNIRAKMRSGVKSSTSMAHNATRDAAAPPEYSRRDYI